MRNRELTRGLAQDNGARQRPKYAKKWSWRRDLNPRPSDYKIEGLVSMIYAPVYYQSLRNTRRRAKTL